MEDIVAAILLVIGKCCKQFCNHSGIAQHDVVLCFARALIEARLFLVVKVPYRKVGAWSSLGVEIDEFAARHDVHYACLRASWNC